MKTFVSDAAHHLARHPLARARSIADAIGEALRPGCERIEVAGSIRRGRDNVKDIEIVALPRAATNLLGERSIDDELRPIVDALVKEGRLAWRASARGGAWSIRPAGSVARTPGRKYYPLVAVRAQIPVDLFAVIPPAQWGAILAIRTGPGEYSKRLVTMCQDRGLRCVDGRLVDAFGHTVPTPEERDFIASCGAEWAEPGARR
jgi:DNA polymerase/3'-5' exonuclease PolX